MLTLAVHVFAHGAGIPLAAAAHAGILCHHVPSAVLSQAYCSADLALAKLLSVRYTHTATVLHHTLTAADGSAAA